jgi:ornithine cyclodeaminase/alanine dehydrogenase-like protein (mu-crystallin family)
MTLPRDVLVLERHKIAERLRLDECIAAVESAFGALGRGEGHRSAALVAHVEGGGFHVKAALFGNGRSWFVAKANANFPGNPGRFELPTIQGTILVFDGNDGRLRAVMDSAEITLLRTAAATAVAAKHLARAESQTVTVCGCGEQGRAQLAALKLVLPIARAYACDREPCQADRFAAELSIDLGIEIQPTANLAEAARRSDVIVTCTPSREFLLARDHVRPGTFIAAVGADYAEKREIHPALLAAAKVVVDDLEQCATSGDLHHALESGDMTRDRVHAELAEVVARTKPGRTSAAEITLFDSTGIALEDAAAAVLVVERALTHGGVGTVLLGA